MPLGFTYPPLPPSACVLAPLLPSASNPQALLRRLEKRILVPLPNVAARRAMFVTLLAGRCAADVNMDSLAEQTEGYRCGCLWRGRGEGERDVMC